MPVLKLYVRRADGPTEEETVMLDHPKAAGEPWGLADFWFAIEAACAVLGIAPRERRIAPELAVGSDDSIRAAQFHITSAPRVGATGRFIVEAFAPDVTAAVITRAVRAASTASGEPQ